MPEPVRGVIRRLVLVLAREALEQLERPGLALAGAGVLLVLG